MKLTSFKRLFAEDYKEAPKEWFPRFLENINNFMDPVVSALRSGLNFRDNFQCEFKDVKVKSGEEVQLGISFNNTPSEVVVTYVDDYVGQTKPLKWALIKPGIIKVTLYLDRTDSYVPVTIRIMQ